LSSRKRKEREIREIKNEAKKDFQETTTKISDPNSKYYGSIHQNGEVRFSSFYMENQKAINLFEFKRNV
jgi:hypothetical protein